MDDVDAELAEVIKQGSIEHLIESVDKSIAILMTPGALTFEEVAAYCQEVAAVPLAAYTNLLRMATILRGGIDR